MQKEEILLAFTDGENHAVGNVWRITAKKTDFYIDPWGVGESTGLHLSAHGPNQRHPRGHRFHVKIDRSRAGRKHEHGHVIRFSIPRKGIAFDGVPVGPQAWRIARLRWTGELQRPRFRRAALTGAAPDIASGQSGYKQEGKLQPNDAWDVDLVISYGEPFWPDEDGSLRAKARIGPLRNAAGLCLTGTSYGMTPLKRPTPEELVPPLPRPGDEASRIMCGGLDTTPHGTMYWFVETVTSRDFLEGIAAPHK